MTAQRNAIVLVTIALLAAPMIATKKKGGHVDDPWPDLIAGDATSAGRDAAALQLRASMTLDRLVRSGGALTDPFDRPGGT